MYEPFLLFHLFALFLLVGVTFAALAAPHPERRRFSLMWSGILSLIVFVTGFGLLGLRRIGFEGWVSVKLACWLALAVMASLAFRQPEKATALSVVTMGAVFLAVAMVLLKPF